MRDGRDAAHEVRKDLLSSHYHSLSLCYILQTTKIRVTLSLISKYRVAMLRDIDVQYVMCEGDCATASQGHIDARLR